MTESLAALLAARLAPLPLMDRVVGLVRTLETQEPNGDDMRTVRLPVPVAFTAAECDDNPRYLVPDAATASIFFFEDQGTVPGGIASVPDSWTSTLRLIGWVNPAYFAHPITDTVLVAVLIKALRANGPRVPEGDFADLLITASVPAADTALLARYTLEGPLLQPPYRVVGLDLKCTYRLNLNCAAAMPTRLETPTVCS